MKKMYLLLLSVFLAATAISQVSVTVTNPANTTPALAASYTSLSDAVTALSGITAISGPVALTCAAGSETSPAGGYVVNFSAATSSTNTVTVTGTGVTITAPTTHTVGALNDAIFKIIGSDWVTLEGFTMLENAGNTVTAAATNTMTEWGVALLYATTTNGAQNCTIQNNTITLNRTYQNTSGIYANAMHSATVVTTSATATTTAGGNSGLKIYGNTISNVNEGIAVVGPSAASDHNNGVDIGGASSATANTISNYGTTGLFSGYTAVSGTVFGILVRNSTAINISYNTITSSVGGVAGSANNTLRGIYVPAFISAPVGTYTNTINNNTIALTHGYSSGTVQSITVEASTGTATSTLNINNNNFTALASTVATSGLYTIILNAMANLNTTINGNTFTNLAVNSTVGFTFISNNITMPAGGSQTINNNAIVTAFSKTGAGGTVTGITSGGSSTTGTSTWNNNDFSNITVSGATTLTIITNIDGGTINHNIMGNTISNIIGGSSAVTGISSSFGGGNGGTGNLISGNTISGITCASTIVGIQIGGSGTTSTVSGNTISGLSSSGAFAVSGITSAAPTSCAIFKNKVYDLSGNNAGSTVNGILVSGGTLHNVYNNVIGNLTTPAANAANPLVGINVTGGTTVNLRYNTVLLNATSSGALFGSSAISASSSPTLELRNNIFINLSTPVGATGFSSAYRRSSTTLTSYAAASNNNLFYAGTPGVNNVIFNDGTNRDQTLAAYKIRAGVRDAASVTENSTFASTTGSSPDFLHFAAAASTLAEGTAINITGITDDFDADIRQGNPGYVGTGLAPDMGADEFEGTNISASPIDMSATALVSPAAAGCYGAAETVTVMIKNNGTALMDFAVTPVTVSTEVTGALTQSLSAIVSTGTLAVGASMNVNMSATLDMTTAGVYTFNAATAVAGDGNAGNDAMAAAARTVVALTATPYSQDFSAGTTTPAGWTTTGWTIASSHGRTNNGIYKNMYSSAITGQFDLLKLGTIAATDAINFDYRIVNFSSYPATATPNIPDWGTIQLQVSTDCGGTFTNFQTINTTNHISSTGWATKNYSLSAYAGQQVIFRLLANWTSGDYYVDFDNFNIKSPAAIDMGATVLVTPTGSGPCFGAAEAVSVTVKNYGTATLDFSVTPATVTTNVTGAATQMLTGTLTTGTLAPGASTNVVMSTTLDMTTLGAYTFNASTTIAGDGDATNDAMPATVVNKVNSYFAVASGPWENVSTWGCAVPSCDDIVTIPTGINVTVNGAAASCKTATIASGGTITVSGNALTIGCTLNNAVLSNNGTLTVSGGTLMVNGNLMIANGSNFNQSSGEVIVDGNANGVTGSSVASGTNIVSFGTSGTGATLNLTGGKLTIVDPHTASSAAGGTSNGHAFAYWGSGYKAIGYTVQLGDGISTEAGGHSSGFQYNTWPGTGYFITTNLIIDANTGTNRNVTTNYSTGVEGDLTINSGEFAPLSTLKVAGNLNVNTGGTLTSVSSVVLSKWGSDLTLVTSNIINPNAQTVGGGGTYRNLGTAPTASLSSLVVNNSSPSGVTLSVPISVSGTLTLTAGVVNTTAANTLTLGISPAATGTLSRTSGFVKGPFSRYYGAATTAFGASASLLPIGSTSSSSSDVVYYPAEVAFTTAPSTGGILTGEFIASSAGNTGLPQADGAYAATDVYAEGYWKIENTGIVGGTYGVRLTGSDFASLQLWTSTGDARIIKRATGSGTWGAFEGTHTNGSGYMVQRDGLTTFSEFALTKNVIVLPISLQYFKGAKTSAGNAVEWKVNCTSARISMEIERSADARNFSRLTTIAADKARCNLPFNFTDAQALKATNYYRLKMIDMDGKVSYSAVIAIINADKGIEIVGMYPTVVNNSAFLSIAAAKAGKVQTMITDMSGKLLQSATKSVAEGSSLITVDCSALSAGVYHITGYIDGARSKTIRFIKL